MKDLSSIIDSEYRKILVEETPLAGFIPSEEMWISIMKSIRRRVFFRRTLAVAAAVCSFALLSYTVWYMHVNYGLFDKNVNEYFVESGTGDRIQTIFQEGSKVYLNSGSILKYPDKFGLDSREVYLDGEAYFDIAPDSKRPFVVRFADGTVKVYGTKFNLKAYSEDEEIVVSLEEGSVKVSALGDDYMMKPSDILVYDRKIGVVNIFHDSDPVKNSLWKHNLISFRDGTLAQVLTQLSRIYGVDFVLQGEIPDYKLTFTTEKESLSHILEELELISSLTFSFTSDKVVTVTNE
jgi:ferric-dicitrate binding protein FerR (iron transport regulator)